MCGNDETMQMMTVLSENIDSNHGVTLRNATER